MKLLVLLSCYLFIICISTPSVFGCTCIEAKIDKKDSENNYKQWLNGFNGAVFQGQVIKIEEDLSSYELIVTFEVAQYWKGVTGSEIIIHTPLNGNACGAPFRKGEQFFVVASLSEKRFITNLCSYNEYTKNKAEYLKGLGKGIISEKSNFNSR